MPAQSSMSQRDAARDEQPAQARGWLSTALESWDATREALMQFERAAISAQPNERQWSREVRRLRDAIRRADRTRPRWVQLDPYVSGDELGDEPRSATWTERQLEQTRAAARRLRAELERAQTAAREARRVSPASSWVSSAAQAAEETMTGILRPLSLAVATATGPAQSGLGTGLGLGVAALALVAFVALR